MATKTKSRTGITLQANELRAALAAVGAAVPGRSPTPTLTNVRIGDGLMSATDLEVRIDTTLDYHGDPLLLPHARLKAILGAGVGDEVTLEPKGTSCVVRIGRGEWTLPVDDAAEFPTWEPTGLHTVTRMPVDQFVRAVLSVDHSTDTDSSRYALGAIAVDVNDGVVTFVATDGRRISTAECEHDLAVDDGTTLVPARVMSMLAKLASGAGETSVLLEASANTLMATIGSHTVTAQLVAGRFPNWREAFPKDQPDPTTVLATELLSATKAAAIVASESSRGVQYTFTADGLHLHGQSAELGESSVTCGIVEFGHACSVKLDPAFVREWLAGLPADGEPTVSVQAKDKASAVVLRADSYTGVIMPMNQEG